MKRIFPAVKLRPQTPPIDKREIGDAAIPGEHRIHTSPSAPPPPTRAIGQWARSLEWRHAVTLHILVGKICITFFLFYCEGMLSLVVLWLCGYSAVTNSGKFLITCLSLSCSEGQAPYLKYHFLEIIFCNPSLFLCSVFVLRLNYSFLGKISCKGEGRY